MVTHIGILLDKSGSMLRMMEEAAGAVNQFIDSLPDIKGRKTVTLNQFDNLFETSCSMVAQSKVPKLVAGENYVPRGTTALYDAIGRTIESFGAKKNVIICIVTDGMENSSSDYDYSRIRELIDKKTNDGWRFEFLASNINEVVNQGISLGVSTVAFADNKSGYNSRSAYMTQTVTDYVNQNSDNSS
jgi:hypothetical protein